MNTHLRRLLLRMLQVRQLVEGADAIGAVLVYRHQGFLPNKRQLRMGGLATLEMAQTLRHLVSHGCMDPLKQTCASLFYGMLRRIADGRAPLACRSKQLCARACSCITSS